MKKTRQTLHKGTYIILIFSLLAIVFSLLLTTAYIKSPELCDSDVTLWILLHSSFFFDTMAASLCIAFIGAWLFEHTYRKEHE